jgi:two-component system phosphate regulon sensor histidine kinase PhoR
MSVALIGLMVIQVYWIRNAIEVRQANFISNVEEAASNVVFRLEKLEMAVELEKRLYTLYSENPKMKDMDMINEKLQSELNEIDSRAELESFFSRYFLAEDVFGDLLDVGNIPDIENRLHEKVLDSLISDELNKKSITTNYEYGVFSSERSKMVIRKSKSDPVDLLNKGYAFTLFPSDMVEKPDYLVIYFPNERSYLISQMWGMLSISLVLIIVIIFSFTYTILTIIRQKKLSEMKNDFINNMTHEFKTPISTISLACQALNDEDVGKSVNLYQNYIKIINEENNRLGSMAEKILQSAILDKGQVHLKREPFNIHDVIMDVIKKIGIQVEIKDGKITPEFKADPSVITADKVHITNVINNLLDNANKYTPQKPKIIISTESNSEGVVFSIIDNGIGISKANQKKIFDKLYRVPSGNIHDFKGFGLGLSYVKAVVDMHGGQINLESELKKGTKFDVFLPFESKH